MNSVLAEDRVFAVERALMLLQCFECADETRTLASLAKQSGLYKSTILRLANSMCKMGFLSRQPSGLFALGPELTRLASLSRMSIDIEARVRSELRKLATKTDEGAAFYVRQGRHRVCLFRVDGKGDDRVQAREGSRSPLNNGAAAQVLRAYGKSCKDPDLVTVRRRGWAVSKGDRHPGLAAIAIPVFNREKELLGALAVTGLVRHFTEEREQLLRQTVAAAAQALSADMRFVHPRDLSRFLLSRPSDTKREPRRRERQAGYAVAS